MAKEKIIVVAGATGLQGSAVTRRLLGDGWQVRALTRNPQTEKARKLAALGAEVIKVDLLDPTGLEPVFRGGYGVYSVQDHRWSGYDGEVRQGRNVADAARKEGVTHFIYASAGTGRKGTGVGSWEVKVDVAEHAKRIGLPLTILRPMAFMELMTEPKFYPALSVWHVMPKLMGADRPVPWLAVDDLAAIAASAFADPGRYIGAEIGLASDVRTLAECREYWFELKGRQPRSFPIPTWLYERLAGKNETTMWRWLATNHIDLDTSATRKARPDCLTVKDWLASKLTVFDRPNR